MRMAPNGAPDDGGSFQLRFLKLFVCLIVHPPDALRAVFENAIVGIEPDEGAIDVDRDAIESQAISQMQRCGQMCEKTVAWVVIHTDMDTRVSPG